MVLLLVDLVDLVSLVLELYFKPINPTYLVLLLNKVSQVYRAHSHILEFSYLRLRKG